VPGAGQGRRGRGSAVTSRFKRRRLAGSERSDGPAVRPRPSLRSGRATRRSGRASRRSGRATRRSGRASRFKRRASRRQPLTPGPSPPGGGAGRSAVSKRFKRWSPGRCLGRRHVRGLHGEAAPVCRVVSGPAGVAERPKTAQAAL